MTWTDKLLFFAHKQHLLIMFLINNASFMIDDDFPIFCRSRHKLSQVDLEESERSEVGGEVSSGAVFTSCQRREGAESLPGRLGGLRLRVERQLLVQASSSPIRLDCETLHTCS